MSVKIELSPNETASTLFTRWKSLKTRGDKISLSHAIRKKIEEGIFSENILEEYKLLIEKYRKDLANINSLNIPKHTESHTINRQESDALNMYLLQISNNMLKNGFADSDVQNLYVYKTHDNEVKQTDIKRFSNNFWVRLNQILGTQLEGQKYWKQKYSYKLALETLKRNDSTVKYFLSRPVQDMKHLENIFLKVIKENCKITLVQMQLELKNRKEEEKRRQEDLKHQETQDEIEAKFKRREENLPPEKTYWFEEELL